MNRGKDEAKRLFDKFQQQICNDCGLFESESTATAARNCAILAAELAKGQSGYAGDEDFWGDVIHYISILDLN